MRKKKKVLHQGLVGMVDVLGFKGIWKDKELDAGEIFDWMTKLAERLGRRKQFWGERTGLNIRTTLLSDTAVIGISFKDEQALNDEAWSQAFILMGYIMMDIIHHWANFSKPKNVRGCIAAGEFGMDNVFLLGDAVDEAASLNEQCEGAFVWLAPSAELLFPEEFPASVDNDHEIVWREWDVPLKQGMYSTRALDPLRPKGNIFKLNADQRVSRMLSAFEVEKTKDISIHIKKRQTEDFLSVCWGNVDP